MSGSAGDSGGDDSLGDGRKGGKRELSQSKRAAQNRAAQVRGVLILFFILGILTSIDDVTWEVAIRSSLSLIDIYLLCQFSCHRRLT